jgi:hypothetical protein
VTAPSLRTGPRCSVRIVKNLATPSRLAKIRFRRSNYINLSQRCKAPPAQEDAMGGGGPVEAVGGWDAGDDAAAAADTGGEASWNSGGGGDGW